VRPHGRYFFLNTDQPAALLDCARETVNPLDDRAIDVIRTNGRRSDCSLFVPPAPTCRWLEGARRAKIDARAAAIQQWLGHLLSPPSMDCKDVVLDALWYVLGSHLLLEDLPALAQDLFSLSTQYRSIECAQCEHAESLANSCSDSAEALRRAWEQSTPSPSPLQRNVEALRAVSAGDIRTPSTSSSATPAS
jgi:hypothetical protein